MVRTKSAFTLIELIFAIVVISITVISLPMMNNVISKGAEGNLVQESIFAAVTHLNEITTAHWDDNSLEPNDSNLFARVIDINHSSCTNHLRLGHINQTLHRRCLDNNETIPADADINSTINSLDDYAGTQTFFTSNLNGSQSGYKDVDLNITTLIQRDADFNGTNPDMKRIEINVTKSTNSIPIIVLKTYSANIGEVDYYKRTY